MESPHKDKFCCPPHHSFPVFAGLILVISLVWLLAELKVIELNLPWLPIVLMVVSAGMICKFYHFKKMMEKKD